jgi:hypothetical protein
MNPANWIRRCAALGALALGACATVPTGPTLQSLPGRTKTFEQFQVDDAACRAYADAQVGGRSATDRANEAAAGSAVAGTAIGAAAGAMIGGHQGAGVGAGIGLITGAAAGSGAAQTSYYSAQRRYDGAYHQCMYAKGNKVPVYGRYAQAPRPRPAPTIAQPPANLPPEHIPPPNAPPPR